MPRKTTTQTTTPVDRIALASEAYVKAVLDYCTANRIDQRKAITKMLSRKNSVRVAKTANFRISGVKLGEIFTTEDDLFHVTNRIYHDLNALVDVNVDSIQNDELLSLLQG